MAYFDPYAKFRANGEVFQMPRIKIPLKNSDKYHVWKRLESRLDVLSEDYYGNPYGGRLILSANPEFRNEAEIPDGATIIIPYPYMESQQAYKEAEAQYLLLYAGNEKIK